MRNLVEYPITRAEMLTALQDAVLLFPQDLVGDVRPAALLTLAAELRAAWDLPEERRPVWV